MSGSGASPVFVGAGTVTAVRAVLEAAAASPLPHLRPRVEMIVPEAASGWRPPGADLDDVDVHAGPGCLEAFVRAWAGRLETQLPGRVVADKGQAQTAAAVGEALRQLVALQQKQALRVRERLAERAARRGPGWHARRGAEIAAGRPARVLVVTTRFSTVLRHTAADLADAVTAGGGRGFVSLEADDRGFRTNGLTLRHCLEHDPDVVVGINCGRAHLAEHLPEGVPFVCWVQDAMDHLYPATAPPPGPLDFLAGHHLPDSHFCAAHPSERVLEFPVPVSTAKFHRGSDAPAALRCDVAYASHQSGTAEELHEDWCTRTAASAPARAASNRARDAIEAVVGRWPLEDGWERLLEIGRVLTRELTDAGAEVGAEPGEAAQASDVTADLTNDLTADPAADAAARVAAAYVRPLVERLLRHEMLGWAGEVAEAHGLSLRLFGRGWEAHPTLGRWAAGPLDHGDALRASYAGATVHLHASVMGTNHPRVAECALSGGLPLCRRAWSELYRDNYVDVQAFADTTEPDACLLRGRREAWVPTRHPRLAALLAERDRLPPLPPQYDPLGWDHARGEDAYGQPRDDPDHRHWEFQLVEANRSLVLLDDAFELTFSTREQLEERILRAVRNPTWREEASRRVAGHAERRVTTGAFAAALLGMVATGLQAEATTGARA